MIYAAPGQLGVEAVLTGADPGLVGLGVTLLDPPENTVIRARTEEGIVESAPGVYVAVLTAPLEKGHYLLVWDWPGEGGNAAEEFVVTASGLPDGLEPSPYEWAPTVAEVAALIPSYTRGGFDDDEDRIYGGAPRGTFDDSTSPTAAEVRALINTTCDEVAGRVGVVIPAAYYGLAKATAKWHVCMTIAQNKMPANADEAGGQYRAFNSNFVASLAALTDLSRKPSPTRLR